MTNREIYNMLNEVKLKMGIAEMAIMTAQQKQDELKMWIFGKMTELQTKTVEKDEKCL